MVWMNQKPLEPGRPYLIKHTTQQVGATVAAVRHRVNINTLEHEPAEVLGFNEIGAVLVETKRPLFFDAYDENRATGAFILIDPLTNETVAAGMITGRAAGEIGARQGIAGRRRVRDKPRHTGRALHPRGAQAGSGLAGRRRRTGVQPRAQAI